MHPLAYTDIVINRIDVILKNRSADGRREQKIAGYLKRRLEAIIRQSQAKHPYYKAIDLVRQFLLNQLKVMTDDNVSVVTLRVMIRGKAGVNGNHVGVDIRVP